MGFMENKSDLIINISFMNYRFIFCFLITVNLSVINSYSQENSFKKNLISNMLNAIDSHNQIAFEMFRSERNKNGEFIEGKFFAKLQSNPYKIYAKMEAPREGAEILYKNGENDDKALVNPNSFPYFSLSFDPNGSLLKSDGHHNIKEAGFTLFSKMFKTHIRNYGEAFYDLISYEGIFNWNGKKCHKIEIEYSDYKEIKYNSNGNENLYDIADKKMINVAKLRFLNPHIIDNKKLDKGQMISITSLYSKKSVLYLDEENFFPIYQLIYDEIGLFEKYIYTKLILNKEIQTEEFNRDYKDYNF